MVTIKGIAKELGVSVSAVSRALNPNASQRYLVSQENLRRIEEAAERLGYRRNRNAEFMQRGRSATIGVFIPDFSNRLLADLMFGISETAEKHGFPVSFFPGMSEVRYRAFLNSHLNNPGSGIISYPFNLAASAETCAALEQYISGGGKVLMLNHPESSRTMPRLSLDDFHGGELAAESLLKHECELYFVRDFEHLRRDGFFAALQRAGVADRVRVFTDATRTEVLAAHASQRIGVFAMTDVEAFRCVNELRRNGSAVGRTAFVVGYDDLDLAAECDPPLTTIRQPFRELGQRAVEKLLGMIYNQSEADEMIRPVRIDRMTS